MTEHPSRIGWPAMDSRAPIRKRRIAVGMLYTAVVLNLVLSLLLFAYVIVLKSAHDTEQQSTQQQIVQDLCGLMNRLPDIPRLDPLRTYYHCEPGQPTTQENP
jgi:hypothetical protein